METLFQPLVSLTDYLLELDSSVKIPFRYPVNVSKGAIFPYVLGLMAYYSNYSLICWVYLALHGTYGLMWVLKDWTFPDKNCLRRTSIVNIVLIQGVLTAYLIIPWLLVSGHGLRTLSNMRTFLCISLFTIGCSLMLVSDAQKYYTLKLKAGLITSGLFKYTRSPNYLGETLTYLSFCICTGSPLSYYIFSVVFVILFIPMMIRKDKSLRLKKDWETYSRTSWLFLPKLFPGSSSLTYTFYTLLSLALYKLISI